MASPVVPTAASPPGTHWRRRWVLRTVVGVVVVPLAVVGIMLAVDRAFFSGQVRYSWPPEPCVA